MDRLHSMHCFFLYSFWKYFVYEYRLPQNWYQGGATTATISFWYVFSDIQLFSLEKKTKITFQFYVFENFAKLKTFLMTGNLHKTIINTIMTVNSI